MGNTHGSKLRVPVIIWGILLLSLTATANSQEAGGAGSVSPYYGTFATEVPIAVPEYHGLEPNLKLSYNSSGHNGFVGVGWGLAGLSFIERALPGGGAPRYDANDGYFIDGMELLPCTTQGGTHCTKIHNYARIVQNSNNTWTVTGTNGNTASYEPLHTTPNGTFRWLLKTVSDPRGNMITYHYWVDGDPVNNVYLDRITYNGTEIKFYREARPDTISYATGANLGTVHYRLKTVDIRTSSQRVRAYTLLYNTSGNSSRSLLASVQQFGRDAILDGSGTIIGGTSLPPMEMEWEQGESQLTMPVGGTLQTAPRGSETTYSRLVGDFNGDGKMDLAWSYSGPVGLISYVALGKGDGTFYSPVGGTLQTAPRGNETTYSRLAGDFNGDGKTDLAWSYSGPVGLISYVALGKGDGTFYSPVGGTLQTAPRGNETTYSRLAGDFNGDGKTDLAWSYSGPVGLISYVALGKGDGTFYSPVGGTLQTAPRGSETTYSRLASDFNGDGKTDLAWSYSGPVGLISYVALGKGDGTFYSPVGGTLQTAPRGSETTYSRLASDFNGDGKTDLAWSYSGPVGLISYVALGKGDGTFYSPVGGTLQTAPRGSETTYSRLASDFNGDGKTDLAWSYSGPVGLISYVALGKGDGTFYSPVGGTLQTAPRGSETTYSRLASDFNGDGKTDLAWSYSGPAGLISWASLHESDEEMDLLSVLHSGIGGTTDIEYTPSSAWDNTYMPAGLILQTVSSLTTDDGRGNVSTTDYQYEGGLWSNSERRFLGFRKVTAVIDAQGNYTETYYYQREGSISKPEYTYFRDNQGKLFSYSHYQYTENTTPPYTSVLTERWDYACNLDDSNCRRSLVQFAYDEYGNVISSYEYGDYDLAGDERTTLRGYAANTVDYIVGWPAYENTYAGIGSNGALLQQTLNFYDNASDYTQPPTVGDLTQVRKWNDQTGGYISTQMSYDSYGNLIGQVDERGHPSSISFDPTYHIYPIAATNALGHTTTRTWDLILGVELSSTDPNNATISASYDALGRQLTATDPAGNITTFAYLNWGDPNSQRIRQTQPDGSADGLWTETYQDGLGRVYKTVKEGDLIQETHYSGTTNRVFQESLVYGPGETPLWTRYSYDGAQRLRTITHPDGAMSEIVYGNDANGKPYAATYDELGHEKLTWKDAYGNVIKIREDNGEYYHTYYQYDLLGNLIQVTDQLGNVSSFSWDSLGRKLVSNDPDMGVWSYSYDNGGLLLTQTDAKGQTIRFSYDELGRMQSKTVPRENKSDQEFQWFYDEPGYGSSIGRLTRVVYPKGSESHSWDSRGLEVQTSRTVDGITKTLQHSYDSLGRVSSLTYPDGEQITYNYDAQGRLSSVSDYVTAMNWSSTGQLLAMEYANGTVNTFNYNAERRWLNSAQVQGPSSTLYQASYNYDAAARVTSMASTTHSLMNVNYGYDALNRLTQVSGAQQQQFAYDALGNMTFNSTVGDYQYGENGAGPHAVTSITPNANTTTTPVTEDYASITVGDLESVYNQVGALDALACDANAISREQVLAILQGISPTGSLGDAPANAYLGAFTYDANGSLLSGGGRSLTWDGENQLRSVTQAGVKTNFSYDADGKRIKKTNPQSTTLYFGSLLKQDNTIVTKYYYAGPILVAKQDSNGKAWYHADHLGSTRLMTDESGQSIKRYEYAAFGQTLGSPGTANNERGFTGHISDAESGLVYMVARYYDPILGRFISADTIVPDPSNPQALNRYSYVYNNPISNIDPTGHAPVVAAVASAVATAATAGVAAEIVVVAFIGAGLSIAGYALEDPTLSAIGGILLGFAGGYAGGPGLIGGGWSGGLLGGSVAAATSPLSPLDPGVKEAIGWAYTAYGLVKGWQDANNQLGEDISPEVRDILLKVHKSKSITSEQEAMLQEAFGINRVDFKKINNFKIGFEEYQLNATANVVSERFVGSPLHKHASQQLIGRLKDLGTANNLNIVEAMLFDPTNGLTGSGWFQFYIGGPIGLHSATHDPAGLSRWITGEGCGFACTGGFFPDSPYSGQVGGLTHRLGGAYAPYTGPLLSN